MLYWKYQSPWWLEHADTLFDAGTRIGQRASRVAYCAPRAPRAGSIRRAVKVSALGWDPLGVWLSDWDWNSRIGKEAWQEGVVMDLCRGHLLAQLWSDAVSLAAGARRWPTSSACSRPARHFRNARFISASVKHGRAATAAAASAFVAINNGVGGEHVHARRTPGTAGWPGNGTCIASIRSRPSSEVKPPPSRQSGNRAAVFRSRCSSRARRQAPTLNRRSPSTRYPRMFRSRPGRWR